MSTLSSCGSGYTGTVTRKCSKQGTWQDPSREKCKLSTVVTKKSILQLFAEMVDSVAHVAKTELEAKKKAGTVTPPWQIAEVLLPVLNAATASAGKGETVFQMFSASAAEVDTIAKKAGAPHEVTSAITAIIAAAAASNTTAASKRTTMNTAISLAKTATSGKAAAFYIPALKVCGAAAVLVQDGTATPKQIVIAMLDEVVKLAIEAKVPPSVEAGLRIGQVVGHALVSTPQKSLDFAVGGVESLVVKAFKDNKVAVSQETQDVTIAVLTVLKATTASASAKSSAADIAKAGMIASTELAITFAVKEIEGLLKGTASAKIKTGHKCTGGASTNFGTQTSVATCRAACIQAKSAGCKYVNFGTGKNGEKNTGACAWAETCTPSNFSPDSYDVYSVTSGAFLSFCFDALIV